MSMELRRVLANNTVMLASSFILAMLSGGFPLSGAAVTNPDIAMLSLGVMMSISLISLDLRGLDVRSHRHSMLRSFLLTFGLGSGVVIVLAQFFQGDIHDGWIMLAAVPPAVSVIPFTYMLRGDLEATMVSTTAIYLVSLLLTPLITLLLLGRAISPLTMFWYVAGLILVPMAVSRPLRRLNMGEETRCIAINISYAVLVVAVVGPNRGVFLNDLVFLMPLLAVAAIRTFGVGLAYDRLAARRGVPRERRVPDVLFATYKNTGTAAALSMVLLGPEASLPAAVVIGFEIIWLIFITRSMDPSPTI